MTNLVGQTIGTYQIIERLGRGGMADVYKAYHPDLAQYRAIKVIRPELVTEAGFQERFKREAQAAAALRHPNIVQIHDFGVQDNLYYMVMEYLDGFDLKHLLQTEGPIRPFTRIAEILKPLASALHYAHERGVVHRDIKPANVMITRDNQIILADFGVAKMVANPQEERLTATGMAMGTPAYMAPEQTQARSAGPAADIYSLGVILYEMLTGTVPFSADTPLAVLLKVMTEPMPAPRALSPDVPDDVQGVVLKATQKDPRRRYDTALDLLMALEQSVGLRAGRPEIVTPNEDDATAMVPSQATAETVSEAALRAELKALAVAELGAAEQDAVKRPSPRGLYLGGGALLVVVLLAGLFWFLRPQPTAATWQFIVDASASMNETIGDQSKIEIAREALADELRILPDNVAAGLRVFGGQLGEGGADQDTVQLLSPAAAQGEQLISELARVAPAGEAPLTEAIVQAVGEFDLDSNARQTLIIITDGVDTCEQNAIEQLTTLTRRLGINLDLHLVGLGVTNSTAREELSALAVAVDGRYYEANSVEEIKQVIDQQAAVLTGTPVPTPTEFVAAGATVIGLDTPTQVQFEGAGVPLVYAFEAVAGQTIFFDEQGIVEESFSNTMFSIVAPNGQQVAEQRGTSVNSGDIGPLMIEESGLYQLEIRPSEQTAPSQMTFTIWELDPVVMENGEIPFGQLISGRFETPGQSAMYTFEGDADQTIFFDEQGIEDGVISKWSTFSIFRPNGQLLTESRGTSVNSADIGPLLLPEDGTYMIVIDPDADNIPAYQFFLWDVEPPLVDEREIGLDESVMVDFGVPGQTAVYTFEGRADQTIFFDEQEIEDGVISKWTVFSIFRPNGLLLMEIRGSSVNSADMGPLRLPDDGTYTIMVDPDVDNTPAVRFFVWDVSPAVVDEREIALGEVVEVEFVVPGQTAVYTFEAEQGQPFYLQEFEIEDEGGVNWRTDFIITAPNGLTFAESYGSPVNRVRLGDMTAGESGVYTLTIDPTTDNTPSISFSLETGTAGD
ncbi:MAG: protein kinase [Anaerolineales bacterium]|nr:protein kinase [Anaerolineales bacterium]